MPNTRATEGLFPSLHSHFATVFISVKSDAISEQSDGEVMRLEMTDWWAGTALKLTHK